MAWVWPVATAAASVAGSLFSKEGQDDANVANAVQAQANRDFQERMSSTAYTRATEDMKRAGLNPMLAYSQGGASTPTGGVGNPIVNSKAPMAAAGQSMVQAAATTANIVADTDVKHATVDNLEAQTAATHAARAETEERTPTHQFTRDNLAAQTKSEGSRERLLFNQALTEIERWDLTYEQKLLAREHVRNAIFEGKRIVADTNNKTLDALFKELDVQRAHLEQQHYMKYPGYHIDAGPFVGDASKLIGSAAAAAGAYRGLRRPRDVETHTESWGPSGNSGSSTYRRSR